ncbi:hypothetical protein BDR05DRAFT_978582 [Suillus weaverae]|nr:hypothetical protein BDR05DRAFT_978582 [Suillus weaverae]
MQANDNLHAHNVHNLGRPQPMLPCLTTGSHGETPPFANHVDMYNVIDSTPLGDIPWQSFTSEYNGTLPEDDVPPWMTSEYDVWFRDPRLLMQNILSNPDFKDEFDYALLQEYDTSNGAHRFQDFILLDLSHDSQDLIAEDPNTIGSMFVPIILDSDKTTVSVTTGHNQYWPVYMSIGNICNNLLHSSLVKMLESLQRGMTTPEVVCSPYALLTCIVQNWCPKCTTPADSLNDGTYGWRSRDHTEVLVEEFELGVLWDEYGLVGDIVPFTNYFPQADIHELLSPDILHQLIKGAFKDHIVTWVHKYIKAQYSKNKADRILDDIDHRGFKQWTGDDSKALMKVYIPAIEGHVPPEMVLTLQALINFIYIARRNIIDSKSLNALDDALERFHRHHKIFQTSAFGAPNGLCSSITESKHIKAVKELWQWSSQFEALNQMLLTNQCLDKLAASCIDFANCGMLRGTCLSYILDKFGMSIWINAPAYNAEDIQVQLEDEPIVIPHLGHNNQIGEPNLMTHIQQFLHDQLRHSDSNSEASADSSSALPELYEKITLYTSAVATFFTPSDISGIGGMHYKRICAVDTWRNGPVRLFFSFKHDGVYYPCAFVHWFKRVRDSQDENTGMWVVEPETLDNGTCFASIIHLDCIFRAAHLMPVFGSEFVPTYLFYTQTLDAFHTYYVNKYIDHQAFEITW